MIFVRLPLLLLSFTLALVGALSLSPELLIISGLVYISANSI
jgi:hypothetical protein